MRKIWKSMIASALAVSMVATPVLADDIETLQNQKDAAESEVETLQSELATLLANINQLESDLIAKGEEIETAQNELEAAEALEEAQRAAMALRIKYMYEDGNASLLMTVLSAEDVSDALNKAEYASNISSYDRNMVLQYLATEQQITELKTTLETEQAEMEALQTQYEEEQATLNTTIEEKQAEVANFDAQLQEALAAEAARQAAEEAARQAAAAAAQAAAGGDSSTSSGSSSSGSSSSSSSSSSVTYGNADYNANTGSAIVDAAYTQLGVPYVWGGSTPYVALDCSGLVQYCYRVAGKSIPRTSGAILASGTIVSNPQPGDICWTPGHVAIYIGGGQMIEAQQSGVPVCVSSVRVTYYVRY